MGVFATWHLSRCHPERSEGSQAFEGLRSFAALRMTKRASNMPKASRRGGPLGGSVVAFPAAVERMFESELSSDLSCVNTLVRHVSRFRGKMLRPMLVLLTGKACGELCDAH